MERPYTANLLTRKVAAPLTDEDYEILHRHPFATARRAKSGQLDRMDADMMFTLTDARCDEAKEAKNRSDRR